MATAQTADECAEETNADEAILQTLAPGPLLARFSRSRFAQRASEFARSSGAAPAFAATGISNAHTVAETLANHGFGALPSAAVGGSLNRQTSSPISPLPQVAI